MDMHRQTNLQGCSVCDNNNITNCLTCSKGYYSDTNSACVNCPLECKECNSDTECTSCSSGYYLKNDLCI